MMLKNVYISADNVEVSAGGLFRTAKEYFQYGGEALIIDEIHKYPKWQANLKVFWIRLRARKFLFPEVPRLLFRIVRWIFHVGWHIIQ